MIDAGTIYIQNETISENVYYKGHSIKVGSNVTSTKSIGDLIISSGLTILRGNDVELGPGTQVEEGAQLEINN